MNVGNDDQARVYVELHKEPHTLEEAVSHVIHYYEATIHPYHNDDSYGKLQKKSSVY